MDNSKVNFDNYMESFRDPPMPKGSLMTFTKHGELIIDNLTT